MLAAGTIIAPELLEVYLDRIARLDRELRSYRVVLADSARQEAAAAQARLDAGERLPLLGVPIAIKDDIDVAGEVTTYGSSAYGPAATQDAEVVRRLRAAGAVIVGKTAVPELMIWPFTETISFGATRNPWNTAYAPGGSSGGSVAAVAAGLAAMAVMTKSVVSHWFQAAIVDFRFAGGPVRLRNRCPAVDKCLGGRLLPRAKTTGPASCVVHPYGG